MTNYIALFIGCILCELAYYHYVPIEWGAACNVAGIVTMIHSVTWDY